MFKSELVKAFISALQKDIAVTLNASLSSHKAATDEENIPDNKYDTQSLEASYIAQGQANRAQELRNTLNMFQTMVLQDFDNQMPISLSALVTVKNEEEKEKYFFLVASGGGRSVIYENKTIMVVTPSSPVGSMLMGKEVGDIITVEMGYSEYEYEILCVK